MRVSRHISDLWTALRRGWRVDSSRGREEQLVPQLFLRQLEERRVLTVNVAAAALGHAGAASVVGIDPSATTGSGNHQSPVLDAKAGPTQSGPHAPAKNAPGQSSNAGQSTPLSAVGTDKSTSNQTLGNENSDALAQNNTPNASPLGVPILTLVVPDQQQVDEGTQLAITDIGQITDFAFDSQGPGLTFTYSIDWGDGRPTDTGNATIDQQGNGESPTLASFDGAHTYADNGFYTVTVTVSDNLENVTSQTFDVQVDNVAPTLTVPQDKTVDEGTLLSISNIGQFKDPGFDNPLNVGGETSEQFTYAIDWGDGTPVDSGAGPITQAGSPGVQTQGAFDGAHTYADNGSYVVTVTISDDDGGTTSDTFNVTVDNVAPTLTVPQDQQVNEGSLLSITDIGKFTDPGFDNSLNVGGETSEQFTYAIDWGDGTPVDSGPATIDVPGAPGVLTQGSFDGSHTYADNGVYTVTVTVSDDDGGTTSDTFNVTVDNVAPTLTVPGNQTTTEGSLLSISSIGQFKDPGFDNPLNVGGETSEQFTFAIDWGDGTPLDSGAGPITQPGSPGVLTQGAFDGAHTYADNGLYTVTVTVSDDDGGSVSHSFNVSVDNVAPTLTVPQDQTVNEGSLLSITDIGKFTDPGFNNPGAPSSETFTYSIDWGDGRPVDTGTPTIDVPGSPGVLTQGSFDGSHTYADNGVYTVTVTVTDDDGGTTSETFDVTVNNVAPSLTVPGNQTTDQGALLTIPNIGKFSDPGFDNPLNVGGETSEQFTYAIDWGDGSSLDSGAGPVTQPGSPGVLTSGAFDGAHVYDNAGLYTVTVTVSDDDGGSVSHSFNVSVDNVPPTVTVPENQTVNEGSQLSITDIGKFTDPGSNETFTYSVDWGDGRPVDTGVPTIDVPGSPGVPTQGSFDGSHTYADNGIYTVTVTVNDSNGGSTSETFEVTVTNVAPSLVVPGNQSTTVGTQLTLPNIGQFTDPGFDNPLNVGGETSEQFTFAIDWGDGSPLDSGAGPITQPGSTGVLTAGAFDGAHTYNAAGLYTVTVTISDDDGGTTTKTFDVSVENREGTTLTVPPDQTVNEGSLLSITDIGKFTDPNPNDQNFTFSIDWGDGRPVDTGNATIDVPGNGEVPTQGSFDGSHTYADNGIYTVTVTLDNGHGELTSETFEVTVNNVAPSLIVPGNQTTSEGAQLSIPNIGKFTDPGFDNPLNVGGETSEQFTFAIDWGDGSNVDSGAGPVTQPGSPGVLTGGAFDGSHIYGASGVYTVTVTVSDDDGGTTSQTFQVTVENVAPTVTTAPDQVVNEGSLLSITDIGKFTDPAFSNSPESGEHYTFTIDWGDGRPVDTGTPTIDVPGSSGVPTQGSFDGSHTYADNGIYTVTVTVNDGNDGVTSQTFQVTVNNVAPSLIVPGNQTTQQDQPLNLSPIGQFTDPGFDNPLNVGGETSETFTFSIDWGDGSTIESGPGPVTQPGSVGVLTAGSFPGSHTYHTAGTFTVMVTVSDDDGGTAVGTFTVTVNSVAPVVTVAPDQTINEGSLLSIPNIGKFTDPSPFGSGDSQGPVTYTYSINWGDGTPPSTGTPKMNAPQGERPADSGSFEGAHVYADNGLYTVGVTVMTSDGRSTTQTMHVTVNNVAPTLAVTGNVTVAQSRPISFPGVGHFTDPGFNNPLNVGGETAETFTFEINWGDGSPVSTGAATVTGPGSIGVLTSGLFDGAHTFASGGTFTVHVTVRDDDGGAATGTFQVNVAIIAHPTNVIFHPDTRGAGAGGLNDPRALLAASDARPPSTLAGQRIDYARPVGSSVAGAEPRLVLRVVRPDGVEIKDHDEPLKNEVLDDLRKLFSRLPDGNYRIYQIQPDNSERLVIDVFVRQGRAIDPADELEGVEEQMPAEPEDQATRLEPAPDHNTLLQQPVADTAALVDKSLVDAPQADLTWATAMAAGGGYVAYASGTRTRSRMARFPRKRERSLDKASRLFRRMR